MKNYSVEFLLQGGAGKAWAPNVENPVTATNLKSVLQQLADGIPGDGMVEFIGVRVELVDE
jgi:hypothetical protein